MAQVLDLNALEQPILEIKLRDEERTPFRLITPTVKLIDRFIAAKDELVEAAQSHDARKISMLYDLAAEILSCNADFVPVTAEELRDKYRVTFGDLVVIYKAYLDFIHELNSAKN